MASRPAQHGSDRLLAETSSFSHHGLQNNSVESREDRLESSIQALKVQVFAAIVPQHLENIKDLLLSIVHALSPDQVEASELFLFVARIVNTSMNILILLEATEDMPHMLFETLHQALEDVKTLVVSINRWKLYPSSREAVRKVISVKGCVLEQQILSIHGDLETSLDREAPTRESSNEVWNDLSSNIFSKASKFTVNKSRFYSIPGGSVQFVTNNIEHSQNAGHPDFLGLPFYDNLELEMELHKGKEYRIHRGRASGRAVVVKVFQGPRAKQICLKTAEFNRNLMHSNVLRMIGGPGRNSGTSFLVFDGDCQGTVESQLALALKKDLKEGCFVGANTVAACSLGIDYLQELGLPFPIMVPDDFVLMASKQGRIVLSFDADASWDVNSNNRCDRSAIVQSDNATKICHELIQKTFYSSCQQYYQDQRLYTDDNDETDQEFLENHDEFDKEVDENEERSPDPSQDALGRGPTSRKSQQRAKGHRRELVWKAHSTTSTSLAEVGQRYQSSLARFRTEDVLAHRRVHNMTQIAHRCPGYQRTEIILTPDIERSGIVSHNFPIPNEICSVCGEKVGEKVGTRELFDCLCGFQDNDLKADFLLTVKCTVCSYRQHQLCMNIVTNAQLKSYICWRCSGRSVSMMVSPRTAESQPVLMPSFNMAGSSTNDFDLVSAGMGGPRASNRWQDPISAAANRYHHARRNPPPPPSAYPPLFSADNVRPEELISKFSEYFIRRSESRVPVSTDSPPSFSPRRERHLVHPRAQGKLLVPDITLKVHNGRRDYKASFSGARSGTSTTHSSRGRAHSALSATSDSEEPESISATSDSEESESILFRSRRPVENTRPWSYNNVKTYDAMPLPPKRKKGKERRVIDGEVKEVEVEVEVEFYEEPKRMFLFAPTTVLR